MTPAKFHCDTCNKDQDTFYFDGYDFGDTLLEGVMFVAQQDADTKEYTVHGVTKECKKYFSDLNQKKWLKEAKDHCKDTDIFTCPDCGDDMTPV